MQLVNNSDPSLPLEHPNQVKSLLRWLPALVLGSVVAASFLLGRVDKPADEVNWLTRLANTGNTGAEIQLGMAYQDGLYGLEQDSKLAFTWIKKAADAGDAYAEDMLANDYAKGQGVGRDMAQAEKWWRKAIQDGNADARLQLGEALVQEGHLHQAKQFLQ